MWQTYESKQTLVDKVKKIDERLSIVRGKYLETIKERRNAGCQRNLRPSSAIRFVDLRQQTY